MTKLKERTMNFCTKNFITVSLLLVLTAFWGNELLADEGMKPMVEKLQQSTQETYQGTTRKWWKEQVVYQIYPRSFKDSDGDGIGDIRGIISKLDYLQSLGVDTIWLSPHFDSPNADNGYDIRNYRKVMDEFGSMQDFDEMLAGLKARGLKLIIDLVVNHTSDEHDWFQQSMSSKDNSKRDYYIWRPGKNGGPPNNWPSFFGGSAWQQAGPDGEYYLHYFHRKQPDLNWDNPILREEVYDLMRFWLDKGVDGFRMDVIPLISKDHAFPDMDADTLKHPENVYASGPRLHEFLNEMNRKVMSQYDVFSVGEAFGISPARALRLTDERRKELDLAFLFDIVRIGRDGWRQLEWSLPDFKGLFAVQAATDRYHWPTVFLTNHDNPRTVSKFGDDSPEYRDTSAKLLAMLLLTQKGTPFMYQGDEIGMTNYPFTDFSQFDDVEIRGNYQQVLAGGVSAEEYLFELNNSSRDHARTPMQWDGSSLAGFTTAKKSWLAINPNANEINVADNQREVSSVLNFYRRMIAFRKGNLALIYGDYYDIAPDHQQIFAYTRQGSDENFLIVLNMSSDAVVFSVDDEFKGYQLVLSNSDDSPKTLSQQMLTMSPWEARLYRSN